MKRTIVTRRQLLGALGSTGLLLAAAGPAGAALPSGDPLLGRIENYLNRLWTARARFTQIGPDGSTATGRFFLARPGKLRIQYDPPLRILLVANDWQLFFYDGSIGQVNMIPLSQTPLSILLAKDIRFRDAIEIVGTEEHGDVVEVTVRRRDAPDQGSVTLRFRRSPLELLGWRVIDAQGLATDVELERLEKNVSVDPELFVWHDPRIFGSPDL